MECFDDWVWRPLQRPFPPKFHGSGSPGEIARGEIAVVRANGCEIAVQHPGAYLLVEHERHSAGELVLELGGDVRCDAVCFTPGRYA